MKFAKILVAMIVAVTLLGCSPNKSQNATSTKAQTQPSQSQAQAQAQAPTEPTQLTAVSLNWIGVDQDQLSPNDLKPDGKPDGHFHITVPFSQASAVKSIWIRYSEFGKSYKWGWIYNKNMPINGYMMAVFDGLGKPILSQGDNGYRVDGLSDFDLYVSELDNESSRDTLKFEQGKTFTLEIDYVTKNNEPKEYNCSVEIM